MKSCTKGKSHCHCSLSGVLIFVENAYLTKHLATFHGKKSRVSVCFVMEDFSRIWFLKKPFQCQIRKIRADNWFNSWGQVMLTMLNLLINFCYTTHGNNYLLKWPIQNLSSQNESLFKNNQYLLTLFETTAHCSLRP